MASVMPVRSNTSSSGSSTTMSNATHHPSFASFPASTGPSLPRGNTSLGLPSSQRYNHSSNPSSARSHASSAAAASRPHYRNALPSPNGQNGVRTKPVKSQYPRNSTERHVEYILVASFDIDRGSIMEHQYPGPVGGDEHMLAELMLPDQTHMRSQDWTIFFLHKDANLEEEEREARRKRRKRRRKAQGGDAEAGADEEDDTETETESTAGDDEEVDDDEDEDETDDDEMSDGIDGPPLVYVLNLVNTKQDNTVKRGAVVKAMAVCTRHSFLHIYKPLLLLALEQYFAHPQIETLATLYDAVNGMDLSLMPRFNMLERFILQGTEAKDLFLERFETMIAQRVHSKKEQSVMALAASEPSSSTAAATRQRYGLPRDTHEFESVVHYANVPVPVKIPTAISAETVGDFSLIKLITTFSTPHAASVVPFHPTHPHLTTSGPMTHPMIVLLNALLTQKRIIFLGHNLPSSEVAEAVLAACALASGGLLRGFTRHAFPYTDLTKIDDLLKVPGFIAGVTNPAFANKVEWWDLLCDISTGRMRISTKVGQAELSEGVVYFHQNTHAPGTFAASGPPAGISALVTAGASLSAGLGGNNVPTSNSGGDPTGDAAFMQNVLAAIHERHGEHAIRSKFRRWILKFTRLAASFEESVYGASTLDFYNPQTESPRVPFPGSDSPASASSPSTPRRGGAASAIDNNTDARPPEVTGHGYVWPTPQARTNELAANATRLEGWRNTRSYYTFIQDLAAYYPHAPVRALDLVHLHDKLAKLRPGPDASGSIYLAICGAVNGENEICQLLSVVANGDSGLLVLGTGLFHPRLEVREEVAELLGRVREHEAGRHFWGTVGTFVKLAWERVMVGRVERVGRGAGEER